MREFMIFACGVILCALVGTFAYCGGWFSGAVTMVDRNPDWHTGKVIRPDDAEDTEPGKAKPGPSRPTEKVRTTAPKPD